ncbi:hypothetical protein OHC33_005903 [Knufia fluminis]|uniref:Uncharacterized protein n=1 Tax=Knufia fluminis TaxID=191047 RepID=A0AAN8EG48_9EURO|nr:hypothetical protein OHC33_005903 [Knufia fluminis]
MSAILRSLARPVSAASVRTAPLRSSYLLPRYYASTTKGDSPNATNMGTPSPKPSDSPQEGDIKSSRAQDGRAPQESGSSVARPVSEENRASAGTDEEGGDPAKSDPSKPAEQKKKETLKEGEKPLDPADK